MEVRELFSLPQLHFKRFSSGTNQRRYWGGGSNSLSANDIRRLENMNPLPSEQGEVYLIPLNMVPAAKAAGAENPGDHGEPARVFADTTANLKGRNIP